MYEPSVTAYYFVDVARPMVAKLLAHWILSAVCLLLVARLVPGFVVRDFGTALIAAVVIGFINGTIGVLLKIVTLPLTILTFGIFWLLINAFIGISCRILH